LADFINRIDPATVQVAGGNDIPALDLTLYFNLKKRVYVQLGGDPYTAQRMDPILADGTSGFSLDALDQTEGEWLKATIENIALTQSLYRRFRLSEPTNNQPFRLEPVWDGDAINFRYSAGSTVQCLFFERDFAFPLGNLTLPTTDVPAMVGSSGNLFEAARGIAGTFVTKYLGVALAPADAVTFPVLPPEGAEGLTKKDLVRNLRQLNESLRKLRTLLDAGQVRWSRATGEFRPRQRAD
jgi:hypothetical protein